MGEFAENILGIKEACEFLDYPVVSGNVSFYNGTNNITFIQLSYRRCRFDKNLKKSKILNLKSSTTQF